MNYSNMLGFGKEKNLSVKKAKLNWKDKTLKQKIIHTVKKSKETIASYTFLPYLYLPLLVYIGVQADPNEEIPKGNKWFMALISFFPFL
eukprot:gene3216-5532_t